MGTYQATANRLLQEVEQDTAFVMRQLEANRAKVNFKFM
jgi:hypothetical protein